MVWFALAFMTAAALLCVAWPLLVPGRPAASGSTDVAFYRQQLSELDIDVDRGILRPADVEATRVELGRRLIQAAERSGAPPVEGRRRFVAAVAASLFVVALAAGLYARLGHPDLPDVPLAARSGGGTDFASALSRIEAHVASHPDDARGLEIMAPIYAKLGRFDDAARTYRALIRVLGPTPERSAALGQALVMVADGVVTQDARAAFDAALRGDPAMPQARFFSGLSALQDGDKVKARAIWSALVAEAPPEAPYTAIVRQRIADLDGGGASAGGTGLAAAGPAAPEMPQGGAAVAALPAEQRQVAIRGMVEGLATRLAADGHDGEGWLRLVRAYRVLGEQDKAQKALADARRSLAGDPQLMSRLDQLARELGLES